MDLVNAVFSKCVNITPVYLPKSSHGDNDDRLLASDGSRVSGSLTPANNYCVWCTELDMSEKRGSFFQNMRTIKS